MFGLLNIHKPIGMTSRDVVNRVAALVRPDKVGHAGTLDPLASGVLVVCIGPATRLVEYVQRMPKAYTATFMFGRQSPTDDCEGPVTELDDAPEPPRREIETAISRFIGEIDQVPPVYSAVKVAGRRSYRMARKGETVELSPRKVVIHRLKIVEYEYPELTLIIECGSGTYIRSIGRDLANALGTVAVMSSLVRTSIGPFRLEQAIEVESLSFATVEKHLLAATLAVATLPRVTLTASELEEIANGRAIPHGHPTGAAEIAAVDEQGLLCALLAPLESGLLRPTHNFALGVAQPR
jgi:tRNA pseudouridine55 synthase